MLKIIPSLVLPLFFALPSLAQAPTPAPTGELPSYDWRLLEQYEKNPKIIDDDGTARKVLVAQITEYYVAMEKSIMASLKISEPTVPFDMLAPYIDFYPSLPPPAVRRLVRAPVPDAVTTIIMAGTAIYEAQHNIAPTVKDAPPFVAGKPAPPGFEVPSQHEAVAEQQIAYLARQLKTSRSIETGLIIAMLIGFGGLYMMRSRRT